MAIAIRSSSTSWPTIVRLTSNSTGSSGLGVMESPLSMLPRTQDISGSQLGASALPFPETSSKCRTDRNGEPDPGERLVLSGVGDRYDDADHEPLGVQQWTAGAAGVHGGVELDQPGQGARLGLRRPAKTRDDPRSRAVPQPEWVADGDHVRTDG